MNSNEKIQKDLAKFFNVDKLVTDEDIKAVLAGITAILESYKKDTIDINKSTLTILDQQKREVEKEVAQQVSDLENKVKACDGEMEKYKSLTDQSKRELIDSLSEVNNLLVKMKNFTDEMPDMQNQIVSRVMSEIKLPDPIRLTAEEIANSLETLQGTERLKATAIEGLDIFVREQFDLFGFNRMGGGRNTIGGGVTQIKAGTNISISSTMVNGRGVVTISSTGGGGSGSPGGSDTQLQYNNAGAFGGITGATTNGTVVTLTSPVIATSQTNSYATASTIAIFDASKNLISATTATYPSLTELSYVKGVTSAIQTQLDAKGSGTVTSVSVTTANGVSGSVANATTTPAITLTLSDITPTTIAIGTLNYSPSNALITSQQSVNSYSQNIIQNTSTGTTASADYVVNNSASTDTTFYGNFGMNSTGFTGSGAFNQPSYVYLTSTSTDLAIGTTTAHGIHFVVNSGTTDAMTIASSGAVTIPGVTTMSGLNVITHSSTGLIVRNPANTFSYTITGAAIAAARTLNLPLITGTDTLASLGLAQTWTGAQTFNNASVLAGAATMAIFNTTATNISFAGAATTLAIGAATGTATIANATVTLSNATTLNINGASPSIVTTSTATASVFNTNALTGNLFGAATTITIGGTPTGAVTHNYSTNATAAATTKTVNLGTGGAASSTTNINIGSSNGGTTTVNSLTISLGGTTGVTTTGTIELGAASDTTLARVAAGIISVEGEVMNGYATTATAAGTTTLTITSAKTQYFTGTSTQTVKLPTTSVILGQSYTISNQSTGTVTVQSSGANTIQILGAGMTATFVANTATPTTAAHWNYSMIEYVGLNNAITASSNAATINLAYKTNTVTNNSAATLTITLPTAGAIDGQMRVVRVLDFSAVAQTITWVNTEDSTATAPTTSNGSTTLPKTAGFQYNAATSKWRCTASA